MRPPKEDWVRQRRHEAFAFGRRFRNGLMDEYQERYGVEVSPPPAVIAGEILTDFLGAKLRYIPMAPDRFAETRFVDGELFVYVNSNANEIAGVGDAEGVSNVALWHEGIHIVSDMDVLREAAQQSLPGLDVEVQVVCRRGLARSTSSAEVAREFWAEEAGRAAAVSLPALHLSEPFLELLDLAGRTPGPVNRGFPLLYEAAKDIGVNISALVTQLQHEGLIVVEREDGRSRLHVQPTLLIRIEESEG